MYDITLIRCKYNVTHCESYDNNKLWTAVKQFNKLFLCSIVD